MRGLLLVLLLGSWAPAFGAGLQCDLMNCYDFEEFRGKGFSPERQPGYLDSKVFRAFGLSQGDGVFGHTYESGDFARGAATEDTITLR